MLVELRCEDDDDGEFRCDTLRCAGDGVKSAACICEGETDGDAVSTLDVRGALTDLLNSPFDMATTGENNFNGKSLQKKNVNG